MAKSYTNGIILGVVLAVLALFASKNISMLSFVSTFITWIADWLAGFAWFPASLGSWAYFDYLVAGVIGFIIGLWVEAR